MIVKSTLLFCLLYAVCGNSAELIDDEYPPLEWPAAYRVKGVKLYLESGWIELFKYWQHNNISRLDSNNGAVTKIRIPFPKEGFRFDYEIHPETTETESNEKVCNYKNKFGSAAEVQKPIGFLPTPLFFERVGNESETVKGVECLKFTRNLSEDDDKFSEELWAYYNDSHESWVPVRYETRTSNTRHGYLKDHQILDFHSFDPEFDPKVFNIYTKYECTLIESDEDDENEKLSTASRLESLKAEEKIELENAFAAYKKKFNKQYSNQAEHNMRKSIFYEKLRLVTETNRKNLSYTLALNKMSDRTKEEMHRYRGLRKDRPRTLGNIQFPYSHEDIQQMAETLPSEYDARLEGLVGRVLCMQREYKHYVIRDGTSILANWTCLLRKTIPKSQEDCGSCWTFGTTATVEGALAKSNGGTLISLSNQALLDCSWGMGNDGCDGGDHGSAFKWIMKHGIPTEAEYGSYKNEDGYCKIRNMNKTYKIRGWTNITPLSEQAMKVALLKHGPLSIAIHAGDAFTNYDGGILYDIECKSSTYDLNHEVTLVGYGEKDGEKYWILKNSYGPFWGIDGYIHISTRDNNCGVMTEPMYVVME